MGGVHYNVEEEVIFLDLLFFRSHFALPLLKNDKNSLSAELRYDPSGHSFKQ